MEPVANRTARLMRRMELRIGARHRAVTRGGATMRVEHRFAALLLALTMVGACTSEGGVGPTATAATPTSTRDACRRRPAGRLSWRGVLLLGSTLDAFPFYLSDGEVDRSVMVESRRNVEHLDRILDRMVELGFDTVRVPLGTEAWAQDIDALTAEEWLARVERIVSEAADEGST